MYNKINTLTSKKLGSDYMKKFLALCCMASVLFIAGCGKDSEKTKASGRAKRVKKAEVEDRQLLASLDENQQEDMLFDSQDFRDEDSAVVVADELGDVSRDLDDELSLAEAEVAEQNELDARFDFEPVNFDLNKDTIREDQKEIVARNAEMAIDAASKGKDVFVIGHCCPIGSDKHNQSLSAKRAEAIRMEMIASGVDSDRLKVLGCGSENPVVLTDAKDLATQRVEYGPNRRVEILVQ
jgi:outer membrane protein OmpA-like peptidoglycan-associated protein